MPNYKLIALISVTLAVLLGCAPATTPATPGPGDDTAGNSIVGAWEPASKRGPQMTFKFFDGGNVVFSQAGRSFSGTYQLKEEDLIELTLTGDLGTVKILLTEVRLSGDKLSFKVNDNPPVQQLVRAE